MANRSVAKQDRQRDRERQRELASKREYIKIYYTGI